MPKISAIALAIGCLAVPGALRAASPGSSDSGVIHITVIIPPLAAALATAAEGADGLWSVQSGSDGFMLNAPEMVSHQGEMRVALFSTHASALRVLSFEGAPGRVEAAGHSVSKQLEKRVFTLSAAEPRDGQNAAVFTIGTI
ncbi:MAG TPA: hypothetical protein VFL92_04065 [Sphingomonas sp.]|nr:hypothetical protein [Sphingomonas sp.]